MIYIKEYIKQEKKDTMNSCGDTVVSFRHKNKSYFAIFDGIGSGTYANIISTTFATQFKEKILRNFSFFKVCEDMVRFIESSEPKSTLYTAFTAVYIYNDTAQFFVYEAPNPIIERCGVSSLLKLKEETNDGYVYHIGKTTLEEMDRILIFSDGLTESGKEIGIEGGIGSKGILSKYDFYKNKFDIETILDLIFSYCKEVSLGTYNDDSSMILLEAEKPKILYLFSGPPSAMKMDRDFALDFLDANGTKVICGSTTSDIIARELHLDIRRSSDNGISFADPPKYEMQGATLVTEGAVCLNQSYNLLLSSPFEFDSNTSPEELSQLFLDHDVIHFHIGRAENLAHKAIVFKQLGIEERNTIILKLSKLLSDMGKTILWKYY